MAQITPVPHLAHRLILRQDIDSLLGAGQSFFNSLFSPETTNTKAHGKTVDSKTTPTPNLTPNPTLAANTPTSALRTKSIVQTTPQSEQSERPAAETQPAEATSVVQNTQTSAAMTTASSSLVSGAFSTQSLSSSVLDNSLPVPTTSFKGNVAATSAALSAATTPSPTVTSSTASHKHSSKAGLTAAVTMIALLLLLSIAGLLYFYIRRRRKLEQVDKKALSRPDSFMTISSVDLVVGSIEKAEAVSIPQFTVTKASLVMAPARARLREWGLIQSENNASYNPQGSYTAPWGNGAQEPRYRRLQSPAPAESDRPRSKLGVKLGKFNNFVLPSSLVAGRRPASGADAAAAPSRFSGYELWFQALNHTRVPVNPGPTQVAGESSGSTL